MKEIWTKDGRYKGVIEDSYIVKNAVMMLGGRRVVKVGERWEGREGEGKGGRGKIIGEIGVGEKIKLIELLYELVKGGVKMREEEEMKEVLMELEEEGNEHVEEGDKGEEEGGGKEWVKEEEEEKREWEELSEKARSLVWVIESAEKRREGKKRESMKKIKEEKEEMEKKIEEERRGREEERKRCDEAKKEKEELERKRREGEERIERMKKEIEELKKEGGISLPPPSNTPSTTASGLKLITSLDETSVVFPQSDLIKREENTIIHHGRSMYVRNCFIGGVMTSV